MKTYLKRYVMFLGIIIFMSFGQVNYEQEFFNKALMLNQYEIALAQQGAERSSNEAVQTYSQILIEGHQQILNELIQYGEAKGWTISTDLDEKHQGQLEILEGIGDDTYDESFKAAAITSHEKAIALYEELVGDNKVEDETLKLWVSDKLEALRFHLDQAKKLLLDNNEEINHQLPSS